jgi:hypothetical protein
VVRSPQRLAATLGLACSLLLSAAADQRPPFERRMLVPAFQGAGELGTRAANVLALQVHRTFRSSDGERPGEAFGRGTLLWDPVPLREMSYAEATRRAMGMQETLDLSALAHLVLWGRAYTLGEDVVVQAYLTATPVLFRLTDPRYELWTVDYRPPGAERPIRLSADLPSGHFAFAPVLLSRDAVERYRSIPALTIYADRAFTQPAGKIGPAFRALRYVPGAVFLRSGDVEGWVPLPDLGTGESEVSIFASALFRVLRADWAGAAVLLERVLAMPALPRSIRIDALLLQGLVHEKQGRSGLEWIRPAHELNPYRIEACRYLVQAEVTALVRGDSPAAPAAALADSLSRCRILFDFDDEWLNHADAILASIQE